MLGAGSCRRRNQCVLRETEPTNCSAGSCHSVLPGAWPLIRCFRIADGLNTTIRRGDIGSLAVFAGRLEHHYSTRGHRQLGGLRIAADAPAFFEMFLQGSVSLPSRIPDPLNAHRGTGMRPRITHPFMKTVSFKARHSVRCAIRSRHRRRATRTPSRNAINNEPSGASRAILLRILNGIPGFRPWIKAIVNQWWGLIAHGFISSRLLPIDEKRNRSGRGPDVVGSKVCA